MLHKLLLSLGLLLCALLPQSGQAFSSQDTRVVQVNEQSYIFMIEYGLGYQKYDMQVPVFGTEFVIDATDREVQVANIAAMTLSDAKVKQGSYRIDADTSDMFTFVGVVTLEEPLPAAADMRLQLTNVPFTLTDAAGNSFSNGLSVGELQSFVAVYNSTETN